MTNKEIIDSKHLTKLLADPIIVRIVGIIGITGLSILEILEYNLTRKDVNYALSNGVLAIDKSSSSTSCLSHPDISFDENNILVRGDSYFYNFLNSKVKLTDLGIYILDSLKVGSESIGKERVPADTDIEGLQQQY